MAAYILAELKVTNRTLYERYRDALLPLVDRMGGRLRIDAAPEVLEGDPGTRRVLLLEFPGRDAARLLYEQPEYEQIRALRDQAGGGSLWLLDGV